MNYYRSTTEQDCLNGIATKNINYNLAWKLDFPQ
jgi:hypothetical protein